MPDEHLTNLGSKGLGEPPIVPIAAAIANAIRDATGADVRELPISREEMLRALREARAAGPRQGKGAALQLVRATSLDDLDGGIADRTAAPRWCRSSRDGILRRRDARRHARAASRAASTATRIGAGTTLAELEASTAFRRRCARRAGSPPRRSCAAMGTIGGNLLQSTRCWYWRLKYPCRLHGGDRCHAREGRAPRARDLRERLLRLGASVGHRRGAARARRDSSARTAASCRSRSSTGCPTRRTGGRRRSSRAR